MNTWNWNMKPWTSFKDQVALLKERGMRVDDEKQAEHDLARIGYYRLSGYWYPFRKHDTDGNSRGDEFVLQPNFFDIIQLYEFDNKIKLLAFEAIQQIEIEMRVQISHKLGEHSPMAHIAYYYPDLYTAKLNKEKWVSDFSAKFMRAVEMDRKSISKNANEYQGFALHHFDKYASLPIWAACELWDFGMLSKLYGGLNSKTGNFAWQIAQKYHLNAHELASMLHTLNIMRNIAAHHGRLWNKNLPTLKIKRLQGGDKNFDKKSFHEKMWSQLGSEQVFTAFCLIQRMLRIINPKSDWHQRVKQVIGQFPSHITHKEVSLAVFGVPDEFSLNKWDLWKDKK